LQRSTSLDIAFHQALYFKNQVMIRLAEKYKFRHSFSSSYNPSSNGQAEAFNKVLCKISKKNGFKIKEGLA